MNLISLDGKNLLGKKKDDIRHIRIDFNVKTGQVDIHSSIGDPKLDLEALLEGVALSVAINARIQKKTIEEIAKQVYITIERTAKAKQKYSINNH